MVEQKTLNLSMITNFLKYVTQAYICALISEIITYVSVRMRSVSMFLWVSLCISLGYHCVACMFVIVVSVVMWFVIVSNYMFVCVSMSVFTCFCLIIKTRLQNFDVMRKNNIITFASLYVCLRLRIILKFHLYCLSKVCLRVCIYFNPCVNACI